MGASTEPAYTPVATEVPVETVKTTVSLRAFTEEEEIFYRKHSMVLLVVAYIQMAAAFFFLFQGWFLVSVCSIFLIFMGISGARRRRVDLLTSHWIYTLWLYILSIATAIISILFTVKLPVSFFLINFAWSIVQIFGMKSSRAMINLLKSQQNSLPISITVSTPVEKTQVFQPQYVQMYNGQAYVVPASHVQEFQTFVPSEIDMSESTNVQQGSSSYPGTVKL